jgi:hypothetical protein
MRPLLLDATRRREQGNVERQPQRNRLRRVWQCTALSLNEKGNEAANRNMCFLDSKLDRLQRWASRALELQCSKPASTGRTNIMQAFCTTELELVGKIRWGKRCTATPSLAINDAQHACGGEGGPFVVTSQLSFWPIGE